MNRQQAKEILSLYRPDTADATDPAFDAALTACDTDAELKRWFDAHCDSYKAMRARFREIPIPEGFKEQILAEKKVHTETSRPVKALLYLATAMVIAVATFLFFRSGSFQERKDLAAFREWSVSSSLRLYEMNLVTNDLGEIRSFLAQQKFDADFALPEALKTEAVPTGCALLQWHGRRVTMVCFHSGEPLGPGKTSDLFLFIAPASAVEEVPDSMSLARVNPAATASWKENGKIYLLVADGSDELLRKYL